MTPRLILAALLAAPFAAAQPPAHARSQPEPQTDPAQNPEPENRPRIDTPRALLEALAARDADIQTLQGEVRYTIIKTLAADLQQRTGDLYIRTVETERGPRDEYAVRFDTLVLDQRQMDIREHYIFDGRWFVERHHEDKQFNKREIVPRGETLDPMALMSQAPYWVSLGRNTQRIIESYDLALEEPAAWLETNTDHEVLTHLAPRVEGHHHLLMRPKAGSPGEDDWESVRIWFDPETLLPRLYTKSDWTGDLQIVELFGIETNEPIDPVLFDTRTPPPESGWRVQISPWRGDGSDETPRRDPATNAP